MKLDKILLISFSLLLILCTLVFVLYYYRKSSYKNNHINKVLDIKKEVKKLKEIENFDEEKQLKLLKTYKDGIHDIYDNNGNKIIGIEPDPEKTFNVLECLIQNCPNERKNFYKLKMADIYLNGMHKFNPEKHSAKLLYQQIINNGNNCEYTIEASEKLRRIHEEEHWDSVYSWLNLKKPDVVLNNKKTTTNIVQRPIVRVVNNQDVIHEILGRGDSQNTHNSQVNSTIKKSIEGLKKNTNMNISQDKSLTELKQFLDNYLQENDKKSDAIKSLDRIIESKKPLMSTGMKEIEALHLVWNRIHDPIHDDRRKTLKENLIDELVEMQEFGHTVCSNGRFNRIIDTLNVSDPEVKIMDTNSINEEIMNSTAQLRNNLLKGYSEQEKKQLDMGVHIDQDNFDNKFKQKIRDKAKTDYVDTGIMTQNKMDNTLEKWIDTI